MTAVKSTNRPLAENTLPPGATVVIVAGGGSLPAEIADRLAETGTSTRILMIEGEADDAARFGGHTAEAMALGDFGNLVSRLKAYGATHVLLAGTVSRRPRLTEVRPGLGLIRAFIDVAWALAKGDDGLLRAVINHIENAGIRVIAVQDVFPELLTEQGVITGAKPSKQDMRNIEAAAKAARAIGALDIGQAAIAIGGRAIALEGIEGTDGLLARMIDLRHHGRLAGARGGVLVKCAKAGQELRADLPAIGPATVEAVAAAELSGIALEAGRSLILEREFTLKKARESKVFIYGLEAEIL